MTRHAVTSRRLREIRDQILRYVYEHGGPAWSVPSDQVRRALHMTREETVATSMLMYEQGLTQFAHRINADGLGPCNAIAIPYPGSASTICEATIIPTPALTSSMILTTM
jgi:hypothetical protein